MPTTIHGTNGITFNDGSTQSAGAATGFRNRLINGDMRIDQRSGGAAGNISNTSSYTSCDRWASLTAAITPMIWVHQRVATGNNDFALASRVQRTAGATNVGSAYVTQVIESTNCRDLAGRTATLSFYANAGANFSPASAQLEVNISFGSGNDEGLVSGTFGSWTSHSTISSSVSLTTTRTRYSTTVTVPVGTNEILIRFGVTPTGTAGANDWFQFTGVQFEAGSSATEFERRPFGVELALCQRYYDKSYSLNVAPGTATNNGMVVAIIEGAVGSVWYSGGGTIKFSQAMRIPPNFAYYDNAGTVSRFSSLWNGGVGFGINPSVTLYTSDKAVTILEGIGGPSGGRAGSPLICHYIANAEL